MVTIKEKVFTDVLVIGGWRSCLYSGGGFCPERCRYGSGFQGKDWKQRKYNYDRRLLRHGRRKCFL